MNLQPSYPTLNIAGIFHLGSVFPGATIGHKAFPRERFSVLRCAISQFALFGKFIAFIINAIGQLQHKMAVSKIAVVRRYNKGQQSDSKHSASPPVCIRCAWRYEALEAMAL